MNAPHRPIKLRRASRRGQALAKSLLIMLALALLSFTLGFFVLAKMLPASSRPDSATSANADNGDSAPVNAPNANDERHDAPAARPAPRSAPPVAQTPHPTPGPSIAPADDTPVQQPDALDKPQNDAPPATDNRPADNPFATVTPAAPSGEAAAPVTPRHRRRRHAAPNANAIQKPATPDGDASRPENAPPTTDARPDASRSAPDSSASADPALPSAARSESVSPPNSGLYRVQLGVFSTREAAEQQARSANDKGFRTTIQPFTREGRTLYRVQHGLYRKRANAEAARQRLNDASVDSDLVNLQAP